MPQRAWYIPFATSWYFGSTMKMLLLPLPPVWVTTVPPSMLGVAAGRRRILDGVRRRRSTRDGSFVENPNRAIHLFDMPLHRAGLEAEEALVIALALLVAPPAAGAGWRSG